MNPHPLRAPRTMLSVAVSGLLAASVAGLASAPAHAADKTVLKVVGTTDVVDSGLVQNVLEPDFEARYPGIDLQYTGQGTGTAIASAKSGAFSALLVHAASLENQFVDSGYSLEKYGRAVFWGDYVLVGPTSDPAHVLEDGQPSHDTVGAFEKVADAGDGGTADWISRGGTPGTTVQEHAIWKLTNDVPTCIVPGSLGGGEAPVTEGADGTTCGPTDADRPYPAWYHTTSTGTATIGQGANVLRTSACATTDGGNGDSTGTSDCYTFTDRGTLKYLQDQGRAQNLTIVARDNAASAPGGPDLLVNSFHAYGINPQASFTGTNTVDQKSAKIFLKFLTSPSEQRKIGQYLNEGLRPAFIPSAAPAITARALPAKVSAGAPVTIAGTVKNVVPGTPVLDDVAVQLFAKQVGGDFRKIDETTTDQSGGYSFTDTPTQSTRYLVKTPAITKIEIPTLDPPFGDLLQSASRRTGFVTVVTPANS